MKLILLKALLMIITVFLLTAGYVLIAKEQYHKGRASKQPEIDQLKKQVHERDSVNRYLESIILK